MSQQQQQQQLLKILSDLLKLPENRECADCGTRAPTWASTNLGIFVCLRCSGIHRSMGTHISKVKSTSLDKWTPEQVESMQKMGNAKSNAIYEANLDGYRKGDISNSSIALEQWIRDKYERKRFVRRDYDSRQPSQSSQPTSRQPSQSSQPTSRPAPSNPTSSASRAPAKSLPPVSAPAPVAQAKAPTVDLLSWDEPAPAPKPTTTPAANTSSSDLFGDFVAATPSQPAAPAPVDKNSILQLYNTPIAPQAGGYHQYGMQQQPPQYPQPNYNITGLGVPGAMHPGMMGGAYPGMGGVPPGMGMGGMPGMGSPGMGMGMGMGGMQGMNPGMGGMQGMNPGMGGMPGVAPAYPMNGVPQYYGIPIRN